MCVCVCVCVCVSAEQEQVERSVMCGEHSHRGVLQRALSLTCRWVTLQQARRSARAFHQHGASALAFLCFLTVCTTRTSSRGADTSVQFAENLRRGCCCVNELLKKPLPDICRLISVCLSHARTHARTHAHTHTHTPFSFLLGSCSMKSRAERKNRFQSTCRT